MWGEEGEAAGSPCSQGAVPRLRTLLPALQTPDLPSGIVLASRATSQRASLEGGAGWCVFPRRGQVHNTDFLTSLSGSCGMGVKKKGPSVSAEQTLNDIPASQLDRAPRTPGSQSSLTVF